MRLEISNDQLNTIRYALDQHCITMREIIKSLEDSDDKNSAPVLLIEFRNYVYKMQSVLNFLPEV